MKKREMMEFNTVGVNSSDKYYINHDKTLKKMADLKGGAHQQA